jgi:microcystin-dependent protein
MANYVKATNFTAKDGLPTGNSGKIVKGAELDTEYTAIASAIASKSDINSPTFTGTPAAPTASTGTNTTQVATTAFVNASILYAVPAGVITMWSGSVASIPLGWVLCNGSNGTPDLRDRFVVGAGNNYSVNATGGADSVTLTTNQIPSHTHTFTTGVESTGHTHTFSGTTTQENTGHTHSISDPGHSHATATFATNTAGAGLNLEGPPTNTATSGTASAFTGITGTGAISNNHNHDYSGTTSNISGNHTHSGTTAGTGGGLSHENRPPFHALAYIMKT